MTLEERLSKMLTCSDGFHEWEINREDLLDGYYTVLQMKDSIEDELNKQPQRVMIDTRDHLQFFRANAKGDVLEIGSDVGNSTSAFLLGVEEKGGSVTSIDINPKCAENFPCNNKWTFILGSSQSPEIRQRFVGRMFDVLYVDGDHSYAGIKNDLSYAEFVRPGGLILVHDVLASYFPGVRQAFDEVNFGTKSILPGSWGLGVIYK